MSTERLRGQLNGLSAPAAFNIMLIFLGFFVLSYYVSLRSGFRVAISVTIFA